MKKRLVFEDENANRVYKKAESQILYTKRKLEEWKRAGFFRKIWLALNLRFPLQDDINFIRDRMKFIKEMTDEFEYKIVETYD